MLSKEITCSRVIQTDVSERFRNQGKSYCVKTLQTYQERWITGFCPARRKWWRKGDCVSTRCRKIPHSCDLPGCTSTRILTCKTNEKPEDGFAPICLYLFIYLLFLFLYKFKHVWTSRRDRSYFSVFKIHQGDLSHVFSSFFEI